MNYYMIVEGSVEKKVYSKWIPLINPLLKQIYSLDKVTDNCFIIYDGGGYPSILGMIDDAIEDIASSNKHYHLIVVIDSEEMTYQEKFDEMESYIKKKSDNLTIDYKIIIQHFCFETWVLGNKKIVTLKPSNPELIEYLKHFNVRENDPELLTSISKNHGNRAQFAEKYLRKLIQEKHRQTYTKQNPDIVTHPHYFEELKKRLRETNHINSFGELLTVFL